MIDYSFLRFERTLRKAKDLNDPLVTEGRLNSFYQVHLKPNEVYSQITNFKDGIVFSGDYQVFIVDSCGNELTEITDTFFVFESNSEGVPQIYYEFIVPFDYGLEFIHLKIVNLYNEETFYSAPFVCSETLLNQTSLFTYRSYGKFFGIDYNVFDFYQNIRLNIWFDKPNNETETNEYYQITTRNTISSRPQYKQIESYKSTYLNRFTFERANIMLIHDVCYVNGIRITNKPQLNSEDRLGNTNKFGANVDLFKDYCDTYNFNSEYFRLQYIYLYPLGLYNIMPINGSIQFNFNVFDNEETIIKLIRYSNDEIVHTYFSNQLIFNGSLIEFNLPNDLENGKYYFLVSGGTISNEYGQVFEGIFNKNTWVFRVGEGDYSKEDYKSTEYFTNE